MSLECPSCWEHIEVFRGKSVGAKSDGGALYRRRNREASITGKSHAKIAAAIAERRPFVGVSIVQG